MTPKPPVDPKLIEYLDAEADAYLESLPLSHFMEATTQATQREITLESFALLHAVRREVQCFNELLIQYPRGKRKKIGQVVPDNFVLVYKEPIEAIKSFNTQLQPVAPLLVLEYVSKQNRRKDYEDSFEKYEEELKIPYYLLFYPDNEEMTLFKLRDKGYTAVPPNDAGRVAIPELELEAGLLDHWVRYWFRGELLPLPGELLRQLNATRDQLGATREQLGAERTARQAAEQAKQAAEQRAKAAEAELARLREELAKPK
jgi:Uma2 family endonuclease